MLSLNLMALNQDCTVVVNCDRAWRPNEFLQGISYGPIHNYERKGIRNISTLKEFLNFALITTGWLQTVVSVL